MSRACCLGASRRHEARIDGVRAINDQGPARKRRALILSASEGWTLSRSRAAGSRTSGDPR